MRAKISSRFRLVIGLGKTITPLAGSVAENNSKVRLISAGTRGLTGLTSTPSEPRNTRYQADATPYLGRSSTGWIAPALPGAFIRSPRQRARAASAGLRG